MSFSEADKVESRSGLNLPIYAGIDGNDESPQL